MEELASAAKRPEEEGGRSSNERGQEGERQGANPPPPESPRGGVGAELNPPCQGPARATKGTDTKQMSRQAEGLQVGRAGERTENRGADDRTNDKNTPTPSHTDNTPAPAPKKKQKLNPKRQHRITRPFFYAGSRLSSGSRKTARPSACKARATRTSRLLQVPASCSEYRSAMAR